MPQSELEKIPGFKPSNQATKKPEQNKSVLHDIPGFSPISADTEWMPSNQATASDTGTLSLGNTTMERQRSFLEKALGAIPGGLALLGRTPVTAALSGGAAEATRQLGAAATSQMAPHEYDTPLGKLNPKNVFGQPASSSGEAARDIATSAGLNALAQQAQNKISSKLPLLFKKNLSPTKRSDLAILKRENIPYTAADFSSDGAAGMTENLLRGTLLGGKVIDKSELGQAAAINTFKDKVLSKIGPLLSNEETGQAVKSAVEGRSQSLFSSGGVFDKAYKRVSNLNNGSVDTKLISDAIAPIKQALDRELVVNPSLVTKESPSRFYGLINDLVNLGKPIEKAVPASKVLGPNGLPVVEKGVELIPKNITYHDVWRMKQNVDSAIRSSGDDPLRTRAMGLLKQVHNALDSAMEESARRTSPEAAASIQKVNKAYGIAKNLFEGDTTVAAIRTMKNPEQIVNAIMPKGMVTPQREIVDAIGRSDPQLLKIVRRRVLENGIESITKDIEGTPMVRAGVLENRFKAMVQGLEASKMPTGQLHGIKEFLAAAKRSQVSRSLANPASGRQLLAYGQIASAGAAVWAGINGDVESAAKFSVPVIGPYVLARILVNPKAAHVLTEGFSIKPETAEFASYLPRLVSVVRQYEKTDDEKK